MTLLTTTIRARGLEPEPLFVSSFEAILNGKMDGFEKLLGKQKYMAGNVRDSDHFLSIYED